MYAGQSTPGWQALARAVETDRRIRLINVALSHPKILGLMAACDAYVSLHRCEGFGRTLAEAMLLEKPVIATDYSGSTEYLNAQTGYPVRFSTIPVTTDVMPELAGDEWAEPDIEHAAQQMRRVFDAPGQAVRIAQAGAAAIRSRYAPAVLAPVYRARIAGLFREWEDSR